MFRSLNAVFTTLIVNDMLQFTNFSLIKIKYIIIQLKYNKSYMKDIELHEGFVFI